MLSNAKIVHLITTEEIDQIVWHLESKYSHHFFGQQLRDKVSACDDLKQEILKVFLDKEKDRVLTRS